MTDHDEAVRELANPAIAQARLGELANDVPSVRAAIAEHPSAYDALITWLSHLQDADVDAALLRRAGGTMPPAAAATPAPAPSVPTPAVDIYATMQSPGAAVPSPVLALPVVAAPGTWREPARAIPLAWGSYELRYAIGLALLLLAGFGPWWLLLGLTIPVFLVVSLLTIAGVAVIPSTITRRIVAGAVGVGVMGALAIVNVSVIEHSAAFADFINSALQFVPLQTMATLAVWFILRMRPGLAYLLLLGAFLETLSNQRISQALYSSVSRNGAYDYEMLTVIFYVVFLITGLILVGGLAWIARVIGAARGRSAALAPERSQQLQQQRETAAHQNRVAQLQAWEAAYAEAHGGQLPPAGFLPPMATAPLNATGKTNTFAILALVFGLGGGVLGIVFGHLARRQIRQTGESGWALATVGLVFGYLGAAAILAVVIFYIVIVVLIQGSL